MPPPIVETPRLEPAVWLRAFRTSAGFSHADLALRLGVPATKPQAWERKNRLPKSRKVRRQLNNYAREAGLAQIQVRRRRSPDANACLSFWPGL